MTENAAEHPMRAAKVLVYEQISGECGPQYTALLHGGKMVPMIFSGATYQEAHDAAQQFRDDAVAKNEEAFLNRQAGIARAKAAKATTGHMTLTAATGRGDRPTVAGVTWTRKFLSALRFVSDGIRYPKHTRPRQSDQP